MDDESAVPVLAPQPEPKQEASATDAIILILSFVLVIATGQSVAYIVIDTLLHTHHTNITVVYEDSRVDELEEELARTRAIANEAISQIESLKHPEPTYGYNLQPFHLVPPPVTYSYGIVTPSPGRHEVWTVKNGELDFFVDGNLFRYRSTLRRTLDAETD